MTFYPKSPFAASALLISILLLSIGAQSRTEYQHTQHTSRQSQSVTRSAAVTPTPKLSSARREWEATRDWTVFLSGIVGDTVVKDSLKELLASGVNVNDADKRGRSALHVAAMLGQSEAARYLLAKGADVNAKDRLGRSPLMISASLGGLRLFSSFHAPWFKFWTETLCPERGASDSSSRSVGELMSWYAVVPAHRALVQLLIEAGADVNATDGEGQTVLDYAGAAGLTDIDRLIWRSGRVRGRQQCELKAAQTLAPRALRLGMTLREVAARFPRYVLPSADACGRLNLSFNAIEGTLRAYALRPEEFEGVSRIDMTFLDEQLAYVKVTYSRDAIWRSNGEYLTALSTSLGLPASWYKAGDGVTADNAHMIGCDGFKVIAGYYGGPYVEMHDTEALQVALRRKAEVEAKQRREAEVERERRRRTFKP